MAILNGVGQLLDRLSGKGGFKPEHALRFDLPLRQKEKRFSPELVPRTLRKVLEQAGSQRMDFACDQLKLLVKYQLSSKKRLVLLEILAKDGVEFINGIYSKYRDTPGLAEGRERAAELRRVLEWISLLKSGYQQVFLDEYQQTPERYQRSYSRHLQVGMRILELLFMEQRICALRYQVFSTRSWRDLNQVFCTLFLNGDVFQPQKLLSVFTNSGDSANKAAGKMSASQLYVSMQLFGLADCYTWPSSFVRVLDRYIALHAKDAPIKSDPGNELGSGHLLTFFNWNRPALFRREQRHAVAVQIDISALKREINNDHATLSTLEEEQSLHHVSAPLVALSSYQRVAFIELLRNKLRPYHRKEERQIVNAYRDFSIAVGFMNCHKRISKPESEAQQRETVLNTSLNEMLEGSATHLVDDRRDLKKSDWLVVNESRGGIQLYTKENPYLCSLNIGQMVLFSQAGRTNTTPQLGRVLRLMRTGNGDISVTLQKLQGELEALLLQNEKMKESASAVPALSLRDRKQNSWQILTPAKFTDQLCSGEIFVRRKSERFTVRVLRVSARHYDFSLLDVQQH